MGRYFGTDGVRGIANIDLKAEDAYRIGRFVGAYYAKTGKKKVLIGKDTRLSGDMLESALCAGLTASGSNAYTLGFVTTPCLAYLTVNEDFDCGIMISASHNPYYDNGIKIFGTDGLKIKDDLEAPIEDYMDGLSELDHCTYEHIGRVYPYMEGIDHYVSWICEQYPSDLSGYNILLDLCNGGACTTAPRVFSALNAHFDTICNQPDGVNINTNCGSTHLNNLKSHIHDKHYDIGFAFDGDADRVLAVDSEGNEIDGDKIIYLLACHLKQEGLLKGNKAVMTVMSNIGLKKALKNQEIDYDITPVGDKNVVDCLREHDYVVGGEQSGHIINTYTGYFGDGVKTALDVLAVMVATHKSVNELTKEVKVYPQQLINVKVKAKEVVLKDAEIMAKIKEIETRLGEDGRILVRPSGTEPLIRVMSEAGDIETCTALNKEVIDLIEAKGYCA